MGRLTACLIALAALSGTGCDDPPPPVRISTFNIENYPKNAQQETAAIDVIGELDADVVAVQEIIKPVLFARRLHARLGDRWQFVYTIRGPRQKLGVVFDRRRFELIDTIVHDETEVRRHAKPTLEVRLRERQTAEELRLFVIHLKAGGDHFRTRARQLFHLTPVVEEGVDSGDATFLVGDFNATGWLDRVAIWGVAVWTGMQWNTRPLACTSYWQRESDCPATALDHIVSTRSADTRAAGACADVGCDVGSQCPTWIERVSDHCPVLGDFR